MLEGACPQQHKAVLASTLEHTLDLLHCEELTAHKVMSRMYFPGVRNRRGAAESLVTA